MIPRYFIEFSLQMVTYYFVKCVKLKVLAVKQFTVQQHIGHDKHIIANQSTKKKIPQVVIGESVPATKSISCAFFMNVCNVLASAIIPLQKLKNCKFKDFLEWHTGCSTPDESTLRKKIFVSINSPNIETWCIAKLL